MFQFGLLRCEGSCMSVRSLVRQFANFINHNCFKCFEIINNFRSSWSIMTQLCGPNISRNKYFIRNLCAFLINLRSVMLIPLPENAGVVDERFRTRQYPQHPWNSCLQKPYKFIEIVKRYFERLSSHKHGS